MRGNHYLVLAILHDNPNGLSKKEIGNNLMSSKDKCGISPNTLLSILKDLTNFNHVHFENGKYTLRWKNDIGIGYTYCPYSVINKLKDKTITSQEYLIYLTIAKQVERNQYRTYEYIEFLTGCNHCNISKYVKKLYKLGILEVRKVKMRTGALRNEYVVYER